MRKWKYLFLIGLASFLMVSATIAYLLHWQEKSSAIAHENAQAITGENASAITPENARKIQPGMSLQEVETILGGPARFDYDGPVATDVGSSDKEDRAAMRRLNQPKPASSVCELRWGSGTVTVYVHFDAAGKSLPVRYMLHRPAPEE